MVKRKGRLSRLGTIVYWTFVGNALLNLGVAGANWGFLHWLDFAKASQEQKLEAGKDICDFASKALLFGYFLSLDKREKGEVYGQPTYRIFVPEPIPPMPMPYIDPNSRGDLYRHC